MENTVINKEFYHCEECGEKHKKSTKVCTKCHKKIIKKNSPFKDFLNKHLADELKEKVTDSIFGLIRKFIFSHIYGTILTVSIVAAVAVSAVAATPYIKPASEETIKLPAITEPAPEPVEEPEEDELTKDSPGVMFMGRTVGEMKNVFGTDYYTDIWEGGRTFYYDDGLEFAHPEYLGLSNDNVITTITSYGNAELFPGASGNVTYPELKAALSDIDVPKPEAEDPDVSMNPDWKYGLAFEYQGYTVMYWWANDPETTKSDQGRIYDK